MIAIKVLGDPAPQGSKRAFVHGGHVNLVESSKKVGPWRDAVRTETQAAMAATAPLGGPVHVHLYFELRRPASLPRRIMHPIKRPDLDKLIRSTLDGLKNGGAYHDDSQVVTITATKTFGTPTGCQIRIEDMT